MRRAGALALAILTPGLAAAAAGEATTCAALFLGAAESYEVFHQVQPAEARLRALGQAFATLALRLDGPGAATAIEGQRHDMRRLYEAHSGGDAESLRLWERLVTRCGALGAAEPETREVLRPSP